MWEFLTAGVVVVGIGLAGIRIVRPTHRAVVERLGKFHRTTGAGVTWVIPFVDRLQRINITEQLTDVPTQEIITKDNMNAEVDLQIYYKVRTDPESLKNSQYNVYNFQQQVVALARTTMRNVIGSKAFTEVNNERNKLNLELRTTMEAEVQSWGVDIVRAELKDIKPTQDVIDSMNKIIKAENEKKAAIDFATAAETNADGLRRAAIKNAEGQALAIKIVADANAYQIKTVNESANTYFVGNAQLLKKLEVTQASLENNTKYVVTEKGITPTIVISEDGKVIPVGDKTTRLKMDSKS